MKNNAKRLTIDQKQLRLCRGLAPIFALLVLGAFTGCKSKPPVDNRPSWVQEAEARLQRPPSWQVSGSGVDSGSGTEARSSFFGSAQGTAATSGSAGSSERSREPASSTARTTTAEPPGVQWSETKVTVSVED